MAEVDGMVRRDRNHPSIVMWEMFNEIKRDGLKRLRREPVIINEVHMYPGTPLPQTAYDGILALGKSEEELSAGG